MKAMILNNPLPIENKPLSLVDMQVPEPKANEILEEFIRLIEEVIGFYEKEDRAYFVLAVGCTGGRHRSVAVVCAMEERLRLRGVSPKVFHRDIMSERDPVRS